MEKEIVRKDRREEVISTAECLIRERGLNGFSFADIAEQIGVKTPAIHHYFPTKADLLEAVLKRESNRIYFYREKCGQLPGDQQLLHLVSVFARNSLLHRVCLIGALLGEFNTFDLYLQSAVQGLCISLLDWVEDFLTKGQADGSLQFSGEPFVRAKLVTFTLSSALLLNRAFDNEGEFECMLNQMLKDLGVNWRMADLRLPEPLESGKEILHSYT